MKLITLLLLLLTSALKIFARGDTTMINAYILKIDSNKTLTQSITEGRILDKRERNHGFGYNTFYNKTNHRIYKITYHDNSHKNIYLTYYFLNEKIVFIKGQLEKYRAAKIIYRVEEYFSNDSLFLKMSIGRCKYYRKRFTPDDLLKIGYQFYSDEKTNLEDPIH